MNYTLQLHGERMVYPIPSGLYDLMGDISREVLRDQPTTIYMYIADYLETLIKVREHAQTAGRLVGDILDENQERLVYVQSLGITWEEANQAASKIQAAFRRYSCKNRLRLAAAKKETIEMEPSGSRSFQEYLKNLDGEGVSITSSQMYAAYKAYQTSKEVEEKLTIDASTYTVDAIVPKPTVKFTSVKKRPVKRDSKLLVYQQSPRHSVESTWSTLAEQLARQEGKSIKTHHSATHHEPTREPDKKPKGSPTESVRSETSPEGEFSLPYYYDEAKHKIPMVTETGELQKDTDTEILTLYSFDSVEEDRYPSVSVVKLPSLTNVPSQNKPQLAKELFDIIEQRSAKASFFIRSSQPLYEGSKEVDDALKKELSKTPLVTLSSTGKIIPKTSFSKGSIGSKLQGSLKSGSVKSKLDVVKEEPSASP